MDDVEKERPFKEIQGMQAVCQFNVLRVKRLDYFAVWWHYSCFSLNNKNGQNVIYG